MALLDALLEDSLVRARAGMTVGQLAPTAGASTLMPAGEKRSGAAGAWIWRAAGSQCRNLGQRETVGKQLMLVAACRQVGRTLWRVAWLVMWKCGSHPCSPAAADALQIALRQPAGVRCEAV